MVTLHQAENESLSKQEIGKKACGIPKHVEFVFNIRPIEDGFIEDKFALKRKVLRPAKNLDL